MELTQNPRVFIPTHQPSMPAHLRLPIGADPSPIVAEFEPDTFTWNDLLQCAEFKVTHSQAVVAALHRHYCYVDMVYGQNELHPEASTSLKRPETSRPSNWRAYGPKIPQAAAA